MAQLKRIFSIIVFLFFVLTSFSQNVQNNEELLNNKATTYMSLSPSENCIYFSSMDWFKIVDCYDKNGKQMFHANVKNVARKQTSQFILMDYSSFDDGEYVIVLRGNQIRMLATLRVFDGSTCVLLYDND